MTTFSRLQARSDPLRAQLTDEMHLRKLPRIKIPARMLQIVMRIDADTAAQSLAHLDELPASLNGTGHFRKGRVGDLNFVFERHSEFATYSLIADAPDENLFDGRDFSPLAAWLGDVPGALIRATHLHLLSAAPAADVIAAFFSTPDLVACDVADGRARIWTDFRLHDDGFGRLLVADCGLIAGEIGQLVQRLQELGNYRKMALLGLLPARRLTGELHKIEQRLARLILDVADRRCEGGEALDKLSGLSVELAGIATGTHYRMSATRAYGQLCTDRIEQLHVRPIVGYPSLKDFTERRLVPALRTCEAFSARLDSLAGRAEQANALLRTRVDIELASQNRDLLYSMNRRARVQLQLQQTVEGLSVVAISYYTAGLLAYIIKAFHAPIGVASEILMAASIPIIVVGVAMALSRSRRMSRLTGERSPGRR